MAVVVSRNPGLQAERTVLAWKRTALAMLGNALLVLRVGMQGNPWLVVGALVLIGAAVSLIFIGMRRSALLIRQNHSCSSAALFLMTTALTAVAACFGLVSLILFEPHS